MAGIYKQGQGYWTRMMTAIALGLVVFMGSVWIWESLSIINASRKVYIQAAGGLAFLAVFAALGYHFICRSAKVGDFLIATEGEMKKVNWSTRREIVGSTFVVILLTVLVAVIVGALDFTYTMVFQTFGVLDPTS